jgi:hypothetical protein
MMPDKSRRLLRAAAFAGLFVLCCIILLTAAPARAQEQQPPGCAEERWVKTIKKQYDGAEEMLQRARRIKEIKDVKETYFGTAPKSFNQYANSNDHILNVRWCQATLVLNDGQDDTLYWYLADEQKGEKHSTLYDHCSNKHNIIDTNCVKYREHK